MTRRRSRGRKKAPRRGAVRNFRLQISDFRFNGMGIVVTEAELIDVVARERAAGRTIAFANGCFDILHVGHVRYLQGSAAEADRLIVAVNDDRSVAQLKGEGRPILPASDRAELVAGLRGVDYVVVFPDVTVERLL